MQNDTERKLAASNLEERRGSYIVWGAVAGSALVLIYFLFLLFVQPEAAYWFFWWPVLLVALLIVMVGAIAGYLFWIARLSLKKSWDDARK